MNNPEYKVLVTCPPMIKLLQSRGCDDFNPGFEFTTPVVRQTLTEDELLGYVSEHDGWIIGDDPVTEKVLRHGKQGRLRAAVKWGVGTDNVDFSAARAVGIPVKNTPGFFGADVADIVMGYIIGLARQTFRIDREIRDNQWPKYQGMALAGKTVAVVGYGDIGRHAVTRMLASGMKIIVYDPAFTAADRPQSGPRVELWPERIDEADFIVLCCSLNPHNRRMLDHKVLARCRPGVYVINVSRGGLVEEAALVDGLRSGRVRGAALEVMDVEPLPAGSPLRAMENCIFGSHNASNTLESVVNATRDAVIKLHGMLQDA